MPNENIRLGAKQFKVVLQTKCNRLFVIYNTNITNFKNLTVILGQMFNVGNAWLFIGLLARKKELRGSQNKIWLESGKNVVHFK